MNNRAKYGAEVIDQDGRLIGWFAQVMMLSTGAHPNTIQILEMASQVAQLVAFHFKAKYRRARPQQICPALIPMVVSPWHASYPSGHSLEAHLIAWALGEVVPRIAPVLQDLAKRIGENREIAGVHYPSDTVAGRKIAVAAAHRFAHCDTFHKVLKAAKHEHRRHREDHEPFTLEK
jgi:acid phosphatase (class A)